MASVREDLPGRREQELHAYVVPPGHIELPHGIPLLTSHGNISFRASVSMLWEYLAITPLD